MHALGKYEQAEHENIILEPWHLGQEIVMECFGKEVSKAGLNRDMWYVRDGMPDHRNVVC